MLRAAYRPCLRRPARPTPMVTELHGRSQMALPCHTSQEPEPRVNAESELVHLVVSGDHQATLAPVIPGLGIAVIELVAVKRGLHRAGTDGFPPRGDGRW